MSDISTGKLDSNPKCPHCGATLNGWTAVDLVSRPRAGDLMVCLYCSSVLQITAENSLIMADEDDIAQCDFVDLARAHKVVKKFQDPS